ncbi:type II toxin-antitoxin system prevent-host-death family antitoxin [bacterium]|nr:type II toxin-antitoxin system prevent-host-death family antitoxin [bacterium]
MERIGIRALQQHASAVLRRVRRGESIEVTERGRPVALLTPPQHSLLDQLRAAGRLTPAAGDLLDLPMPRKPSPGVELPSRRLARLRRAER